MYCATKCYYCEGTTSYICSDEYPDDSTLQVAAIALGSILGTECNPGPPHKEEDFCDDEESLTQLTEIYTALGYKCTRK